MNDKYVGDRDPEDGVDPCEHGCGRIATVAIGSIEEATGKLLCRECYDAETGGAGVNDCPVCYP